MNILIVGPGAMGLLFGYLLKKSGKDIYILDKSEKRASFLRVNGVEVEKLDGSKEKVYLDISTDPSDFPIPNLVIITVKAYDTESAIRSVASYVDKETFVLTLQNGLGNLEKISEFIGPERIIGGVTSCGATLLSSGRIRYAGVGDTILGSLGGKKESILPFCRIFEDVGLPCEICDDVLSPIWSKVIINVGINGLTALLGIRNGELLLYDETLDIIKKLVDEAALVAEKKGIKLLFDDPFSKVKEVLKKTSKNISSMLQDVLRKKRTEISHINGAICEIGRKLGVPTPYNLAITNLVMALEKSYEKRVAS